MEEKYVKLSGVEELLDLIAYRDVWSDWTDNYEEADEKVKEKTEELLNNVLRLA